MRVSLLLSVFLLSVSLCAGTDVWASFKVPLPASVTVKQISENHATLIHKASMQSVELQYKDRVLTLQSYDHGTLMEERKIGNLRTTIRRRKKAEERKPGEDAWQTTEIRFQDKARSLYKDGKFIEKRPIGYYRNHLSIEDARAVACQRLESIEEFYEKISGLDSERLFSALSVATNTDWLAVDENCTRTKMGRDKVGEKLIEEVKQGTECLMEHGDESIRDALGVFGIFFLNRPVQVLCQKTGENFYLHQNGQKQCYSLPREVRGAAFHNMDETPVIAFNIDRKPNPGLTFHELMHFLGYEHDEFPDIIYLTTHCCFPDKKEVEADREAACRMLKNRPSLDSESIVDYAQATSPYSGFWYGGYVQEHVLRRIKQFPSYLPFNVEWRTQAVFGGLKSFGIVLDKIERERSLTEVAREEKLTLLTSLAQYRNILNTPQNKRMYSEHRERILKGKNLEESDIQVAEKMADIVYGIETVEGDEVYWQRLNDLNAFFNSMCAKGKEFPRGIGQNFVLRYSYEDDRAKEALLRLMGRGSDCENRPALLANYIDAPLNKKPAGFDSLANEPCTLFGH